MWQKCPICNGAGVVDDITCTVCKGKKIIHQLTGYPPNNVGESFRKLDTLELKNPKNPE